MNHLNLEDGSDVYVVFIKLKLLDFQSLITLGTQSMLSHIIAEMTTSNIHPSLAPSNLTLHKSPYKIFTNYLLKTIRPSPNPVYDIPNSLGLCLLTRLRLGLCHLNEHIFNHNFKNPLCACSLEIESTSHFSSIVIIITTSGQTNKVVHNST